MVKLLESPVSFSDSELDSYARKADSLTVRVKSWNGKLLVLVFRDVIGQRDLLAGEFSDAVVGAGASEAFLQEALRKTYTEVPVAHPYQVFSFLNHDDEPSLEVVAAGYVLSVEGSERGPDPGYAPK